MAEAITKNAALLWDYAANKPWLLTQKPFRVAPRVYYVGNTWVGAYLIDTEVGLILIDTTVFESVYLVLEAIRELGYDPHDIKHILLTHCHVDHSGGVNQIQAISGARVWQSREDTDFMVRPANLEIGDTFKISEYTVDAYFDDYTPLKLGDVSIKSILTPGHTPGTTSFFITVPKENGGSLVVGLHGGVGPNTMSDDYFEKFGEDKGLRRRFIEDCESLKSIHVDIAIPSHPAHGDLMKRISSDPMDYTSLIDDREWAKFLEIRKNFAQQLEQPEI